MNLRSLATYAVATSILFACCTSPDQSEVGNPVSGKVTAPITIEGVAIGTHAATIRVKFPREAKDVTVALNGTGGLHVVTAEKPIQGRSYAAGASEEFKVSFTPGEGMSHLGVHVSGTFDGAAMSRNASFAVGKPTKGTEDEGVEVDSQGRRIKVPKKK